MKLKLIGVFLFIIPLSFSSFSFSHQVDSLKQLLNQATDDSAKYHLYLEIIDHFDFNQIDSSLYYTTKMVSLVEGQDDVSLLAGAYFKHGLILFQKYNGSDTALYFLRPAFDYANSLSDTVLMSKIKGTIGNVYSAQNNLEIAVDHFIEALSLLEGRNGQEVTTIKVVFLNNIGRIEFLNKNFEAALVHFKELLPLAEEIDRPMSQTIALTGISSIYAEKKNLDSAIFYMTRALDLAQKSGLTFMEANGYGNLGQYYVWKDQFEKAEKLALEAIKIFEENGWVSELSFPYNVLSNAQYGLGKNNQSVNNGKKSVALARENNRPDHLLVALRDLANTSAGVGDHAFAYDLMTEHQSLQDSLNKMDRAEIVEDMKARYDSETKEAKIKALDLENNLLMAQADRDRFYVLLLITFIAILLLLIVFGVIYFRQRQIRQALEKENELREAENDGAYQRSSELARLIHDGPVNDLKQLTLEQELPKMPAAMTAQILSIIGEMRHLAHQLEYRGIASGHMQEDVERLCQLVKKQHKQVSMQVNWTPKGAQTWQTIPSDTQVFVFQTVREAVYNALKHAAPTIIILHFSLLKDTLKIKIEDNGTGIRNNEHAGIGIKNMMKEVAKRNGQIKFDEGRPTGTIISIDIPCASSQELSFKMPA